MQKVFGHCSFSHLVITYELSTFYPDQHVCALSSFACSRTENMVTCSFLWSWNKASHFTRVFLYPSVGPYPDAASKNPFLNFLSFSPLWQWLSFSPGGINKSVLSFDLGREAELPLMAQWAQSLCLPPLSSQVLGAACSGLPAGFDFQMVIWKTRTK